jgi:hypothetical protein
MPDLFTKSGAELSPCGRYRHYLYRQWDESKPVLVGGFLNPSVADAFRDDQTLRLFMGRARRMDCGGVRIVNAFDFRATEPAKMKRADVPLSPANDTWIIHAIRPPLKMFIAGWGDDGAYLNREAALIELLCIDHGVSLYCLGLTKAGHPRHPLRVPYSVEPVLWKPGRGKAA